MQSSVVIGEARLSTRIKYKESYGKLPDAFSALGYDSAMMLCKAIRASQSYNPEAIRASLAKMKDFIGVTGKIIMDKEHNPIKPGVIMEFKDGQKVFKMRILSDVKNQSSIPSSPETSEVTTEEPSIAEMIKDAREYSSHFPAFKVTCDNNEITWIRGDANFNTTGTGLLTAKHIVNLPLPELFFCLIMG